MTFSFEGWQFTEWLKGWWPTVKEVVKIGVIPLVTYWLTTGNLWATGFGAIAGKFVLDSLHYAVKPKEA